MRNIILVNLIDARVGIQALILVQPEESSVWIEGSFENLVCELAKKAPTVDASFIKARSVHEYNFHFQLHIWL